MGAPWSQRRSLLPWGEKLVLCPSAPAVTHVRSLLVDDRERVSPCAPCASDPFMVNMGDRSPILNHENCCGSTPLLRIYARTACGYRVRALFIAWIVPSQAISNASRAGWIESVHFEHPKNVRIDKHRADAARGERSEESRLPCKVRAPSRTRKESMMGGARRARSSQGRRTLTDGPRSMVRV